ncbi:MAG: N-acetyl-gamma-glutamyl-phosphate reductase [Proteobacteria bacterium]|nr:N-acetyl-gamma-glutamyl-phosphate reductase [Pseudomonadota bacterium]
MLKVAVVGARGYVGFELLKLLDNHPMTKVVAAYSRAFEGKAVHSIIEGFSDVQLCYRADELGALSEMSLDVIFLALPNELAKKNKPLWQNLSKNVCIIDLSSDFRFDADWTYGQPETCAEKITGQKLIANPGCYATASQLGLLPIIEYCDGTPSIFGVSGYSGAGSKPSENNNPQRLANNLKAYKLIDHIHEREVSHVLGKPVHFIPHVAEFFRGIHLTLSIQLNKEFSAEEIECYYKQFYQGHELIKVRHQIPEVQQVQNTHKVIIGGFAVKNKHLVLCVCLDNLLKGAATQAIQNMNLALGLEMNLGVVALL